MDYKKHTLEALNAYLNHTPLTWSEPITPEEWSAFFDLASRQKILSMVFEAVYSCPAMRATGGELVPGIRRETMQSVMVQAMATDAFLQVYKKLTAAGLKPLVVKGVVCRSLYPDPDFRPSGDEDIYISRKDFRACHELLTQEGLMLLEPDRDIMAEGEVPYGKPGTLIHIEVHKELFPGESEAYGELNGYFEGCLDRACRHDIDGVTVWSMGPTDHFLYLIFHAFKHFVHSGFGIRQVCDIVVYGSTYWRDIDWRYVLACCREVRADRFAMAIMQIGIRYLSWDPEACHIPAEWLEPEVDPEAMLEDLLSGGVFGAADLAGLHSATITLHAVVADRRGEQAKAGVLRSLFPPRKELVNRYPWLRKQPVLLPAAWGARIVTYGLESLGRRDNNARETIRIGQERVELLRKYGVIR